MDARAYNIIRFLDGGDKKFIIPVYQRTYSWKIQNCEQLLKDLKAVYQNNYDSHFFGSIVYVEEDLGGCNEYIIVDGQQRITTVSILLLAIRNYLDNNNINANGINISKIMKAYLTDEYANDEKKLKLKLVQGDDEAYNRLIENENPIENNSITINYMFFYNQLEKMEPSEISKLYEAITKLMIVAVSLKPQNGDDPQLIFESLNSTGLDLQESDKIRNYVLMGLDSKRQENLYRKYWERIELLVGKQDMSKFIRYYLAIKTRELPKEDKLYFEFKKYKNNYDIAIENILEDVILYAQFYNEIIKCNPNDNGYKGAFGRLMHLEVNTSIPLLFDLLFAHKNDLLDNKGICEASQLIESYYVRRMICGLPISSLNRTFVSIGTEIEKYINEDNATYLDAFKFSILSRTGKSRFPNDHEFNNCFHSFELYNAKPAFKKYILEQLENSNSKERIAVEEQINSGTLTIEHVMPQTLTQEWKTYLGDTWELIYAKYLHTIGNLTLTAYNSDYSNLSFEKKKEKPENGFIYSKLFLNDFIKNAAIWNENTIIERAELLFFVAKNLWAMPVTNFCHKENEQWIDLDDEYDFTSKTIVKMVFLGDEISTNNISDAYNKINVQLYMLDPENYLNIKSKYISSNEDELRKPYKLSNSLFIETNLSSQSKVNEIRKLLKHFDLDPQDLSFLVKNKKEKSSIDIFDETSFQNVKIGYLAYELIKWVLENDRLSFQEITNLMTKEYTRAKFKKVVYPVLAESKNANRGNSMQLRYYKDPVVVNGKNYFITSQWFEESREDLLIWFNKHK